MLALEQLTARYLEKRQPFTNLPLPKVEIPDDLKLVVKDLGLNPKLVAKLNWHRNFDHRDEVGNRRVPDLVKSELLYALSTKKVRTHFGTKADLLQLGFTELAAEHKSGVFGGHVFGVQGDIGRYYQNIGGASSELGLPVSDEYIFADGVRSDFQGGSLFLPNYASTVQKENGWNRDTQKMLAIWSNNDLKKITEPEVPTQEAAPSPQGTEGLYMTLKDSNDSEQERHLLILHKSGKYVNSVVYVNCWDNRYYNLIGGTASRLGFPIPKIGVRESDRTIMPFEGGNLIWTPSAGQRHSIKS